MTRHVLLIKSTERTVSFEFFTGRNEVLAKVIFLHLSVIHSVHRGVSQHALQALLLLLLL